MLWYCIIANVSYFTHHVCPFLQKKIQSSLTPIYLEPHKGDVLTSYWQEDAAFFCRHSFRTCRLNCQFFHWPWTAWESTMFSYLYPLFLTSCASLVRMHLGAGFVSILRAQHHTVSGLSLRSQPSNTHLPTNPTICTISKWTQSVLRQRREVCFTQSALSQQGKG